MRLEKNLWEIEKKSDDMKKKMEKSKSDKRRYMMKKNMKSSP